MHVPPPVGDDAWAECLRDLKRTLEGGGIFVVGREQRIPVHDPAKESGNVSQGACEAAFQELSKRIKNELLAQAKGQQAGETARGACLTVGCVRPAGHDGPCIDGTLQEVDCGSEEDQIDPKALQETMRRIASYISVAPGMQAIMKHSLPPSLWQPTFAVCVGHDQVRVLTLAFVGEPVSGDRPSCKCTPFILRLLTGNLATAEGARQAAGYSVRPALPGVGTINAHLAALEPELFEAADSGDWASISEAARAPSACSSRCPSSAPATPILQARKINTSIGTKPPGATEPSRHVGDRAARMRATFERAQSRPPPSRQGGPASEVRTPARERAERGKGAAPSFTQTPQEDRTPPSVSVIADGLSVRSVAGALNNVAATTGKIQSLFRRARSPAWLRPGGGSAQNPSATSDETTSSAPPRVGASMATPVSTSQTAAPPVMAPQQAATPASQKEPRQEPPQPPWQARPRPPSAFAQPPAGSPAPAPAAVVAAAPAPARHVVDRAARMRERINRAQSTQAGKRHLPEPSVALRA